MKTLDASWYAWIATRLVDGLLSRKRRHKIPAEVDRAARMHGTSALLEYSPRASVSPRATWHRRRQHPVPIDLFEAAIGPPLDEADGGALPASYPASPRARRTALDDDFERRSVLLASSRELLRIEIRCARHRDEDAFSVAVARALRRRSLAPLLAPDRSSPQLRLAPSGLGACRRRKSRVPFASTRSAAPVPRRAWVYWEVAFALDDSSDSDEAPSLVEAYVGVAPAATPLDTVVGAGRGQASLASLGGLLVERKWKRIEKRGATDDEVVRVGLFGPGDTVGILACHDTINGCLLRFFVDETHVAYAALSGGLDARLYPALTLRSRNLHATCAFTARDLRYRPPDAFCNAANAVTTSLDPRSSSVYAVDGTRLRRGVTTASPRTPPPFAAGLFQPNPTKDDARRVTRPARSAPGLFGRAGA